MSTCGESSSEKMIARSFDHFESALEKAFPSQGFVNFVEVGLIAVPGTKQNGPAV